MMKAPEFWYHIFWSQKKGQKWQMRRWTWVAHFHAKQNITARVPSNRHGTNKTRQINSKIIVSHLTSLLCILVLESRRGPARWRRRFVARQRWSFSVGVFFFFFLFTQKSCDDFFCWFLAVMFVLIRSLFFTRRSGRNKCWPHCQPRAFVVHHAHVALLRYGIVICCLSRFWTFFKHLLHLKNKYIDK
jgi:hypothetical protein